MAPWAVAVGMVKGHGHGHGSLLLCSSRFRLGSKLGAGVTVPLQPHLGRGDRTAIGMLKWSQGCLLSWGGQPAAGELGHS